MTDIEQRVAAALRDCGYVSPEAIEGWAVMLLNDLAADGLVVVPRYTVDPFGIWQGECGHLWRKADSEHCPACATIDAMRPVVDKAVAWYYDSVDPQALALQLRPTSTLREAVAAYLKKQDDD